MSRLSRCATLITRVVALFILGTGCSPSRFVDYGSADSQTNGFQLRSRYLNRTDIRKGYGSVELCLDGEKLKAEFELSTPDSSSKRIIFYSFFGNEIGHILLTTDSGYISFQGREFVLGTDQNLDTLGYSWGKTLSMHDFLLLQCGVMPADLVRNSFTDEVRHDRFFTTVFEYRDPVKMSSLRFLLRFNTLKRIVLDYSVLGKPFLITQSHFRNGIPQHTTLKTDEKNYYRIVYRKILVP